MRYDIRTADKALYFPYINVPENSWFTRVLLYWDEVGSIVPSRFADDLGFLSPYMGELIDARLVRPVIPDDYTWELFQSIEPFFAFVDEDPEINRRRASGEVSLDTTFQIHGEKLGLVVANELKWRNLARCSTREEGWYDVEPRTATAFMAHLATTLAKLPEVGMDPVTDKVSHLAVFGRSDEAPDDPIAIARGLRLSILEGILPGPSEGVPIHELVDFKDQHGELLGDLRQRIEPRLFELALIDHEEVRTEQTRLFERELEDKLEEIEARMRERWWPDLVFGTLCGVVAAAIPVAAAAATGALPAAAAGVPGLAHAVYSALGAVSNRNDFMSEPLAYAALSRARFG
jgi:Family of unknown function (DUF6236)